MVATQREVHFEAIRQLVGPQPAAQCWVDFPTGSHFEAFLQEGWKKEVQSLEMMDCSRYSRKGSLAKGQHNQNPPQGVHQ